MRWWRTPASATDRSFKNWVSRQQNLVRVRRIENLLMFFCHWQSQKLSRFGGSNTHTVIQLSPSEVISLLDQTRRKGSCCKIERKGDWNETNATEMLERLKFMIFARIFSRKFFWNYLLGIRRICMHRRMPPRQVVLLLSGFLLPVALLVRLTRWKGGLLMF